MKSAGRIVLIRFPRTDLVAGKLRFALVIGRVPGPHDDWMICMISSQLRQYAVPLDEIIREDGADYGSSRD